MPDNDNLLQYLSPADSSKPVVSNNEDDLLQYLPSPTTKMKANIVASSSISPDQAAQEYNIFKQTKIPINIVRTQANDIKQMTELNAIDYDKVAKNFPRVAQQLSDPNKAAAIRDDVDNLTYFERIFANTKQAFKLNSAEVSNLETKEKAMLFDVTGDQKYALTPIEKNNLSLLDEQKAQQKDYKLGFAARLPEYTIGQLPNLVDTGISSITGAATGFAVGGPVGAAVGGASGAALHTARLETAAAYDEFKNLRDEKGNLIEKQTAAGGAIATGVINGLLELVPFETAAAPFKKAFGKESIKETLKSSVGKELFKNIGKVALAEGATEALQEYSNIAFAEIAKNASDKEFKPFGVDKDKITPEAVLNYLASDEVLNRVSESAVAGFGGGLGFGATSGGIVAAKQVYDKRKVGDIEKEQIGDVVAKTKESKIYKRSPDLFKDATDNTLGEQDVFIPAEKVQTYFQTKTPEELNKFYQQAPEAKEQLQDALEAGGDVILKGNNAAVLFANPSFQGLQEFARLSSDSLAEEGHSDAFLQDVVSNVEYEDRNKEFSNESVKVKRNISKQILNLGLPLQEAQSAINLTESFYDTLSKRLPEGEAQKILNSYIGKLEAKKEIYGKEILETLKQARKPSKKPKAGKPLLKFLKEKGGVKLGSNLAGELNALGITPKTAPALFKKAGVIGDVDNFVASEFQAQFPNANLKADEQTGYVDRQTLLDALASEVKGVDISKGYDETRARVDDFIEQLDRLGLDLNAPDVDIVKAIEESRKNSYNQTPINGAPTFYSALEKQITDLPQGKGSPEQWVGIIKNLNQKGVKQEEIDLSGVQDWLKEQKGSVTKEQIVDYLKANQIQVEEVVKEKTEYENVYLDEQAEQHAKQEYYEEYNIEFDEDENAFVAYDSRNQAYYKTTDNEQVLLTAKTKEELKDELLESLKQDYIEQNQRFETEDNTKFSKYTLAGGENYRELLMTLPVKESINKQEIGSLRIAARALIEQEGSWKDNYDSAGKALDDLIENPNLLEDYKLQEEQKQVIKDYLKSKNLRKNEKSSTYKSSHYEEPNILAHIRFNERTDKDGARVMFVEELQSDWHQEGRKKGYKEKFKPLTTEEQSFYDKWRKDTSGQLSGDNLIRFNEIATRATEVNNFNKVPDAPFKTTWPELAFKRALLWAVENGFDKIAWTTGEQQAERYDLSKQIDEIVYFNNTDGTVDIQVGKGGNVILSEKNINQQRVSDLVGKDISDKIFTGEGKESGEGKSLSGLDLKVGGEGMKAFYDKIVPTMANKLVKKFGGKVEQTEIDTGNEVKWEVKINENSESEIITDKNEANQFRESGYIVKEIKGKKENVWSLEITPAMRDSIQKQGLPLFQNNQNPQGQTQFTGKKPIITLFQNKDKSTLLHELGHVFLQTQADIARLEGLPEQLQNDWATLEEWLGIDDGKITTEAHEKFARGFEQYLREGKAPSLALRNAFRKFKEWLLKIYKSAKDLNVELNDEVRAVFDRMLAVDEAIELQKNNPLYREDDKINQLLTKEEKLRYAKLTENAAEKAKEKLTKEVLAELEREEERSFKNKRIRIKNEVRRQLQEDKTYRALHFLKTGKIYGEEAAIIEPYKINRAEVKEEYPEFYNKLSNKDILGDDGVSVENVADNFGFNDAGEMLNNMAKAPPFNKELNRITDQEMIARYGDILLDGTIEEKAQDAAQNEARASKIIYELNAANRKVKTNVENKEAYKEKAKEILARKPIKEASDSYYFYNAEIRAAREAGKALGEKNYEKAVQEKKKQLLNHYLYRESLQLKKDINSALKRYARYKRKPTFGKVALVEEYRQKIVNLLADFGLATKEEGYERTNIPALEAWKKEQTEEGVLGLAPFPELEEIQNKRYFKDFTTDQFYTFNDAIENLANAARGIVEIEKEGKRVKLNDIANDIVDLVKENLKQKPEIRGELTPKEKLLDAFESIASFLIKTKNIALRIDGEKPLGQFYNYFIKDVAATELKKNEMMDEAYKKLDEIYKKHFDGYKIPNKKTYFPEVNHSYSKQSVLAFALNWGNEINRRRIKEGFNYSERQVNSIISSLTKNEWEFVQDMWNLIDSYWPKVEALEKKLFGFAPAKQKAAPVRLSLNDGSDINLKGGYYPIVYTDRSLTLSNAAEDIKQAIIGQPTDKINFHKPYTKERLNAKIDKKVDLTLRPGFTHITQVVNDIAMKEAVWNSFKIINNPKVKNSLVSTLGVPTYKQLQTWLQDMYGRTMTQEGFLNELARKLRQVATTFQMGFKFATVIIQLTGFLQSIPKVGYKNMGIGLWKALGNGNPAAVNKSVQLAFAKSKILKDRSKTFNRDIYEVMNALHNKGQIKKNVAKFAFLGITKMQMLVDIPTWYAAYYKGLKDFKGDDSKAAEFADLTLEKTQGSSHRQALSAIERNEGAMARAFTTFYTYFNVKLNLLSESYRGTNFKKPRDVASFASDFLLLFFLDGLMTEFLRQGLFNGDDSDDEEDKTLHYLNLTAGSLASTVPGVSQLYSRATGYNGIPAGLNSINIVGGGLGKLGKETINAIDGDEDIDLHKVLEGLNETGAVFGYGGGSQIDIFLDALQKEKDGEETAPIDYILRKPK